MLRRANRDVVVDASGDDGLLKLSGGIESEEIAGGKGERHAFVVCLQVIVHLGQDQGGKLALREGFILVQSLTKERNKSELEREKQSDAMAMRSASDPCIEYRVSYSHLPQGARDLGPNGVDVIVECLQGEDLELGFLVGEEAQHSSR